MNIITQIADIIEKQFENRDKRLSEPEADMTINVITDGCQCAIYSFDKKLGKEYKGGIFPFFAKKEKVNKINDYTIFAEYKGRLYCLIIELKKSKCQTFPQLRAGHEFAKFIIGTVNRINKTKYEPIYRFISIKDVLILKKRTKAEPVKYDANFHCILRSQRLEVRSYLL